MAVWVADIGGSSSRWARIGTDQAPEVHALPGFNPVSGDPVPLASALDTLRTSGPGEVTEVFIYGAGCGSASGAERMQEVMATAWPGVAVDVRTDILGAARSLYGTAEGLVLVLGTGMSVGRFDGRSVRMVMPSTGYVLGDEGSGADLGKHLVKDALLGRLSAEQQALLFPEGIDRDRLLQGIHGPGSPQAFLAGYARRLATPGAEAYASALLTARFTELASLITEFLPDGPIALKAVGSIAWGYRSALEQALGRKGITVAAVEKDPLEGLLRYHSALPR